MATSNYRQKYSVGKAVGIKRISGSVISITLWNCEGAGYKLFLTSCNFFFFFSYEHTALVLA